MGITQQIGASSLIKPGVIDNTAARPASPYEGQVIFQKDTDQLLVWNGTAWIIPNSSTQNPTGLELITTKTTGASGLITFYSTLSASYDNYLIKYSTSTNTSSVDVNMRMANATTPVGGTSYNSGGYRIDYPANGGVGTNNVLGVGYWSVGRLDFGSATGSATIELFSPFKTSPTTFSSSYVDNRFMGSYIGRLATATSYDGFDIQLSTSWAGQVSLYGYRN